MLNPTPVEVGVLNTSLTPKMWDLAKGEAEDTQTTVLDSKTHVEFDPWNYSSSRDNVAFVSLKIKRNTLLYLSLIEML